MKRHLIWLLSLLLSSTLSTYSSSSFAQKIKVHKVKGNQAVVEFSGGNLHVGQAYELAPDEFGEATSSTSTRDYVVTLSVSLQNTKSDASGAESETDLSLTSRFGWNLGTYELGPLFSYTSDGTGSITTTLYKFGAFGDYNMIANMPGESFIYGFGGTFEFGGLDSGVGSKKDLIEFFVGPFAKWFPTGSPVGFRIDGGYVYQKQTSGVGSETTISGLSATAGLTAYF